MPIAKIDDDVEISYEGHTPNIEEPGLFNLHVAEFLAAVEGGSWAGWRS